MENKLLIFIGKQAYRKINKKRVTVIGVSEESDGDSRCESNSLIDVLFRKWKSVVWTEGPAR